jgi:hypothetical protein
MTRLFASVLRAFIAYELGPESAYPDRAALMVAAAIARDGDR